MWYITTAEANDYLQTSWQDSIIAIFINQATELIDRFCERTFASATPTERYNYIWNGPYYLKSVPRWANPITHIYWSSVSYIEWVDYIITWNKLEFKSSIVLSYNTDFNYITFTYTSWYTTIPDWIKDACYIITASLYNLWKAWGTSQFTQGDLSISFNAQLFGGNNEQYNNVKMLLSKYKSVNVIS